MENKSNFGVIARIVTGVIVIALGLLIAIGPQTMFKPCHGEARQINEVRADGLKNLLFTAKAGEPVIEEDEIDAPENAQNKCGIDWLLGVIEKDGIAGLENAAKENDIGRIVFRTIPMRCHWGARSLIGTGGMIALLGIGLVIAASKKTRLGLAVGVFLSGIIALLTPMVIQTAANPNKEILIGVCGSATMECRTHYSPAITSISILLIVISVLYTLYLARAKE